MKKIAIVFDFLLYGGIERVGIDYINLFISKGYQVDVYILNPKHVEGIINDIPKECNIKKIHFPQYICPDAYWRIAKLFWWGKYAFPLFYIFWKVVLTIAKYIVRPRKKYDVTIAFAGHVNDLTFVAYDFLKTKKKCCWLHGGLYSYVIIMPGFEALYNRIKNLVVLKEDGQVETLFYNRQLKNLNIEKIYNPSYIEQKKVDTNIVSQLKEQYGDFILMVSRLCPPKNHKCLIKAIDYISTRYGVKYNLVIAGDGPQWDELKEFAQGTSVAKYIHFVGNQSQPQNFYAACHIFAFSSFSEGLPTVLIEAAYYGVPIVSSDSSVREILGNNNYGIIVPIDDHQAMGEQIYKVMTNKELYSEYAAAARERYNAFSPSTIGKKIEVFFNKLK